MGALGGPAWEAASAGAVALEVNNTSSAVTHFAMVTTTWPAPAASRRARGFPQVAAVWVPGADHQGEFLGLTANGATDGARGGQHLGS